MEPSDRPADDRLPPVEVDVDAALDRTHTRGRRRRRRRTAALAVGAIAVVVLAAAAVAATGDDREGVIADGPTPTTEGLPDGDRALWHVDPDDPPDPEARSFTALVTRIGCHGGVTGDVLGVRTVERAHDVVLTFVVERAEPGAHECPGNDAVPYTIRLGSPIGDRVLRDGTCALDPRIVAADCVVDDGTAEGRPSDVRWPQGAVLEPRECEADEGSPIDVAHEPDTRRYADWSIVTDTDLCIVRIDVVSERSGVDHCGYGSARVLIVGDPFGARHDGPDDTRKYIRDPDGAYGDPDLVAGFAAEAELPDDAEPTGFLLDGDRPIWIEPDDPSAVYVWNEDTTIERWPRGDEPICN